MKKNLFPYLLAISALSGSTLFASKVPESKPTKQPELSCSAWSKLKSDVGLSFFVDFLYWQASQTGMEYGQVTNYFAAIPVPGGGTSDFTGSYENVDFHFDPGVRVGLGFRPRHDDWQINFIWTHLNTKASGSSGLPGNFGGVVVTPNYNFFIPQLGNNGVNAQANWWAWYNTIDLDIYRGLSFCDSFGLKPHLGLRNLWLNQKYNVLSINTYTNIPPTALANGQAEMVQNIWGIGPMIGIDSLWEVYGGFGLFGKATFSLIWSNIHSTNVDSFVANPPAITGQQVAQFHTILPEIDLVIGGQYDLNFCEDRYHFAVELGWELRRLFSANFLGGSYAPLGDFNMSGLTGGVAFDF